MVSRQNPLKCEDGDFVFFNKKVLLVIKMDIKTYFKLYLCMSVNLRTINYEVNIDIRIAPR